MVTIAMVTIANGQAWGQIQVFVFEYFFQVFVFEDLKLKVFAFVFKYFEKVLAFTKYPSNTLQIPFKYTSKTLQIPFKYPSNTLQIPFKYT